MSGGPVFDESGKLLGLLSSSFETEENIGPSYASLILPALTARFEGGWPESLFKARTTLLELDHRLCSIDGRDAVELIANEASGAAMTRYTIWE